jgi:hypothetical protein
VRVRVAWIAALAVATAGCDGRDGDGWAGGGAGGGTPLEREITAIVQRQRPVIEAWLGAAIPRPFAIEVFEHQADMAAFAKRKWGVPELPCWAVAMGSGSTLVVLAPAVWATEACEHADDTAIDVERIVAHELVHVLHGQYRPDDPELDHVEAAWFAEGLATLASGQLDEQRMKQARQVADDHARVSLAEAWSGPARYAVCGSLVRTIERKLGRAALGPLLALSTTDEILRAIGMKEAALIAAWRIDVRRP